MKIKHSIFRTGVIVVLLIFVILSGGFLKTVFFPTDEIPYENRPAKKIEKLSFESYISEEFQSSMENALGDQVHWAIKTKKLYNIIETHFALPIINALTASDETYIKYRNRFFYKDMLVVPPIELSEKLQSIDLGIETLNQYFSDCPDADFYVYYIETDCDVDFDTGQKSGVYEYYRSKLILPGSHIARLKIDSFEDYHSKFLKTDHHWNYLGAYQAYTDICSMLGVEPLEPKGEHTVYGNYLGTRAAGIEGLSPEDFTINVFDFPEMQISYTGYELNNEYGQQSLFLDDALNGISYGAVFGGDYGELIFDTGCNGENILVLGDSYDNALIKALASCFNTTYSVDLRAFEADTGYSFDIKQYIDQNNIDKVLIIGELDYFIDVINR